MERHFLRRTSTKGLPAGRQGFTLLELLISIAIIGILISIGVVSYSVAQKKARDSRRLSDLKAVQAAFEQYYADHNGSYPAACGDITSTTTYLPAKYPADPKSGITYDTGATCLAASYCFCAKLEGTTGNSDVNCSYGGTEQYFCVSQLQ